MVRTFVRRKGEECSQEIDLDRYNSVLNAEMVGNSIKVEHFKFVKKEDEAVICSKKKK